MADRSLTQRVKEFFVGIGSSGPMRVPEEPMKVLPAQLMRALAQVDPSELISRKMFSAFNPERLVTRKGMQIFDQMKRDEQIKAALRFKKDTILSSGWEVVSPEGEEQDWEVTRFVRDQLKRSKGGWENNLRKVLLAIDYGYSVTEKLFSEEEEGEWQGLVGLDRLISIKPHYIDFTQDESGRVLSIVQRSSVQIGSIGSSGKIVDQQFPPGKFVLYAHNQEFENPYGISDLVAAYRPWWTKDNAYKWLSIYLERYGMPPFLVFYNANAYQGNQLEQLKKLIKNIQSATFGLIPRLNKDDVEMWNQQVGAESKNIYIDALEKFDRDIARSLLVPGLMGFTADEAQGSLARSETHFNSFLLVVMHLQMESAGVVNSQLIKPLCDLNFPGLEDYPEMRYLPFKDENRFKVLETWSSLVAGKVVGRVEDDEVHIRRSLGMPENEDVTLEPLPTDADREAEDKRAKAQAKQPAPVPSGRLSTKQKKFAEDHNGTWFDFEVGMVCLANREEDGE